MSKTFTAYAPPSTWGPWMTIESHGGPVAFKITYSVIGDTLVMAMVRYFDSADHQAEIEFKDEITFQTADVWANIEVRFKGIVTGSTVEGEIE